MRKAWTAALAAIVLGAAAPAWRVPAPGTAAMLGEHTDNVVCDTADRYRQWLNYEEPLAGCRDLPTGLPAVIEGLVYDPAKDNVTCGMICGALPADKQIFGWPLARVRIPARAITGYTTLLTLTPAIPRGALLHMDGKLSMLHLAPAKDSGLDVGPDLGKQVAVRVIRYQPSLDDFDLQVTVADGPYKGRTGWMEAVDSGADQFE